MISNFKKIIALAIVCILGVTLSVWDSQRKSPCKTCNVVLIDIELLRADGLPCYGYARNTTPQICSFATGNTRFTHMYSAASWTLPSIMSFFSSQLPFEHKVQTPDVDVLPPETTTLPQAFQKAGYETYYIGPVGRPHVPLDKGIGRGFDHISRFTSMNDLEKLLTELQKTKRTKPFFVFLQTYDLIDGIWKDVGSPHAAFKFDTMTPPFTSDSSFDARMIAAMDEYLQNNSDTDTRLKPKLAEAKTAITQSQKKKVFDSLTHDDRLFIEYLKVRGFVDVTNPLHMRYLRNFYDDRLSEIDASMAGVLQLLRQPYFSKNTIVSIFSDHGNEFGEHGVINHGNNLLSTTTHIPFILAVPGIPAAQSSVLAENIDIFPTLLGLTGIAKPHSVRGIDLSNSILGKKNAQTRSHVISQLGPENPLATAIRDTQWVLQDVQTEFGRTISLYNLTEDPEELHNVSQKYPDRVTRLKDTYNTLMK